MTKSKTGVSSFFSDSVDIRYRMAQLNNPAFFDHPNQRFVETELEKLRAELYGGAKFHKKSHRGKHSAMASIYGLLVSLVIVGTVCASYLYASSLPLPDLEQYHVLVPVVLSFPFLLISSSLRAICRKALGTLPKIDVKIDLPIMAIICILSCLERWNYGHTNLNNLYCYARHGLGICFG